MPPCLSCSLLGPGPLAQGVPQRRSKPCRKLDHFVLAEIGNDIPKILIRFKARDTCSFEFRFVEVHARGSTRNQKPSTGEKFTLPLGENYRENRSLAARDKVDVLSRAARHGANVRFKQLEGRKPFLDYRQQPGILRSEFLAELTRCVGDFRVIVTSDGTVKMIPHSKRQNAGHKLPAAFESEPLLPGHHHHGQARQCHCPGCNAESAEQPRLRAPQALANGFPQVRWR